MKNKSLKDSFKHAGQGIREAFANEKNFRIHCFAALLVVISGIVFKLPIQKWVLLFLVIGFVFVCELVNTAGEILVDMVTREYSAEAKKVKDMLAGAVLISAAVALITGVLVFIGPVIDLVRRIF